MINVGDIVKVKGFTFKFVVIQKQTFTASLSDSTFALDLNTKFFGVKKADEVDDNDDTVIKTLTLLHVYEDNYANVKNLIIEGVGIEACKLIV